MSNDSHIIINNNIVRKSNGNSVNNGNKNVVGDVEISDKLNYKTTINNHKNNNNHHHNNNDVNFNPKIGEPDAKTNFTTFDESMTTDTDFFAAFNENFGKNRRNSNLEMVDAFGIGFNANSTAEPGSDNNNLRAHTKHTSSPITPHDTDFEHKFASVNINTAKGNKMGFEDEDGFADFSAFNAIGQTTMSNSLPRPIESKIKMSPRKLNPIRGSDFEKLNANTVVDGAAKIVPQYGVDYSKSDQQFEDDLQAALQRSLVDQWIVPEGRNPFHYVNRIRKLCWDELGALAFIPYENIKISNLS